MPRSHSFTNNKQINSKTERCQPARRLLVIEIMDQLNQIRPQLQGKHLDFVGKKRKKEEDELNWRKNNIFWKLPYWSSLLLRHNLDVMHMEKNVCDSLLGTIINLDGKLKDTNNARFDLANLNIRPELHMVKDGTKWIKSVVEFTISIVDRQNFSSS